jgi:hypothetical protein
MNTVLSMLTRLLAIAMMGASVIALYETYTLLALLALGLYFFFVAVSISFDLRNDS